MKLEHDRIKSDQEGYIAKQEYFELDRKFQKVMRDYE